MLKRLQRAFATLDRDQRVAGAAALALLVTLFLPWYDAAVVTAGKATNPTFSAFGVFSFVEAAVLVVALGVFVLLFQRGEGKPFHLPGGDGTVVAAAGLWAAVLLLWRVFDRPDVANSVQVGITWGFFFAFLAAGGLTAAGLRIRAAHRPEPANPMAAPEPEPPRARRRPLADPPTAGTEYLPEREQAALEVDDVPDWEAPTRRVPRPHRHRDQD